jgi:hypothetical protein
LDTISSRSALTADQQSQFAATLTNATKPKTQLLLIPVAAVQKLVYAASQPVVCATVKP